MNINFLRLRPLLKELRGIHLELRRANDMRETELAYNGIHIRPPVADTSGPEPEVSYVNEEDDAMRELEEYAGKIAKQNLE